MPRVTQEQLGARRREILAGARACFARYGYEGATVRRLEEEIGLSRGAIFHYFRDKESLFLAVAEDDAASMVATVGANGLVQVMRDLLTPAVRGAGSSIEERGTERQGDREHVDGEHADGEQGIGVPGAGVAGDGVPGEGVQGDGSDVAGWLGTQLELSRRLRTDPAFAKRWAERSDAIASATRERLARQRAAGTVRDDVDIDVLAQFLELAYDGLVLHLAMGRPAADLTPVLDLVEAAVRRLDQKAQ